ncbi:hypothetical protein [Ensifer sp. Root278]|uniref:hypothetical protein n=1 Tax=unclassified Ensifer TaxID=2633371 RepID=UPI00070ACF09|nr:hypothetical protein [Ensifer sp. Root278]KRD56461.1 hypothetical protein ASE60_08350 [Ensifer sp. Root278]
MSLTTNSKVLLPHEINQIEQIFVDVLRGLGLSRNSEAAEAIARRIISCYQSGTRESGALKHMIGYYKSAALEENADSLSHGNQAVSIREIADQPLSADELDMLQRTFDRVCIWCSIPRYGKRADRLARHITEQFRQGLWDEAALFESAMWLEGNLHVTRTHDA